MTIESQVCSLELAKQLKELGCPQNTYAFWHERGGEWSVVTYGDMRGVTDGFYAAPTVAELGEIIGTQVKVWKHPKGWVVEHFVTGDQQFVDETMANAMAKMLIHLLKAGHVKM